VPISEIARFGERIAQGVEAMRKGEVIIEPGYDGVFGVVRVLPDSLRSQPVAPNAGKGEQLRLFG
jgi:PHP family Zn ribbon phosphoesterase